VPARTSTEERPRNCAFWIAEPIVAIGSWSVPGAASLPFGPTKTEATALPSTPSQSESAKESSGASWAPGWMPASDGAQSEASTVPSPSESIDPGAGGGGAGVAAGSAAGAGAGAGVPAGSGADGGATTSDGRIVSGDEARQLLRSRDSRTRRRASAHATR